MRRVVISHMRRQDTEGQYLALREFPVTRKLTKVPGYLTAALALVCRDILGPTYLRCTFLRHSIATIQACRRARITRNSLNGNGTRYRSAENK